MATGMITPQQLQVVVDVASRVRYILLLAAARQLREAGLLDLRSDSQGTLRLTIVDDEFAKEVEGLAEAVVADDPLLPCGNCGRTTKSWDHTPIRDGACHLTLRR